MYIQRLIMHHEFSRRRGCVIAALESRGRRHPSLQALKSNQWHLQTQLTVNSLLDATNFLHLYPHFFSPSSGNWKSHVEIWKAKGGWELGLLVPSLLEKKAIEWCFEGVEMPWPDGGQHSMSGAASAVLFQVGSVQKVSAKNQVDRHHRMIIESYVKMS